MKSANTPPHPLTDTKPADTAPNTMPVPSEPRFGRNFTQGTKFAGTPPTIKPHSPSSHKICRHFNLQPPLLTPPPVRSPKNGHTPPATMRHPLGATKSADNPPHPLAATKLADAAPTTTPYSLTATASATHFTHHSAHTSQPRNVWTLHLPLRLTPSQPRHLHQHTIHHY